MKKLIAIDLDGTTLNQDSKISNRTAAALKKASDAGHLVTIATGRPNRMSEEFYKQLQLHTPMVNFNGALVYVPGKKWEGEMETAINRDIVFEILSQKKDLDLDFVSAENRETFYIDSFDFFDPAFFAGQATEKNLLSTANLRSNPSSMLIRTKPERASWVSDTLMKKFGDQVDVRTWGGPNPILEIVAKGIQKAVAVDHVAKNFGISQKDVIAFGDEHNDVELLDYAGWGVAMSNGSDGAKAVANDITKKSNQEDGLADYLENYLAL